MIKQLGYVTQRRTLDLGPAKLSNNANPKSMKINSFRQLAKMDRLGISLLVLTICTFLSFPNRGLAQDTNSAEKVTKKWAISQFGEPEHFNGLTHWPYVNPNAQKGGRIVMSAFGSFDTLNFYVLKGDWPKSIGAVYDELMMSSDDEIDALYGLIAQSVEYPEDKSWAVFNLRPEARYHDGTPILAKDFVFALNTVKESGRPFIKSFYIDVLSAEALGDRQLKFTFATVDNMKPITIAAGLSPLPVHYWEGKDPTESSLEPPLTSGPYRIKSLDPGRSITYERVEDYWAKDLPIKKGLHNIDEIRYEYYKDLTVEFEAFKAGEIDFRQETSAKRWMTEYDLPQIEDGTVIKAEVPSLKPRGMGGYFFNLKRDKFKDIRVREAIMTLYDFEAIQRTLLFGQYKRISSNFPNSDYGVKGKPTPEEIAILKPFADQLPEGTLDREFIPPKTDGSGRDRRSTRKALSLFKQSGWELKNNQLISNETGEQFQLELMTGYPEAQRTALPFIENLKKLGVDASIRLVDSSQWRVRVHDSDFDLFVAGYNFFPPPGSELKNYFGSESAEVRGGNSGGIKNPVVDALIEQIVGAKDLQTLQNTTKALDRVLLWNHYVIPAYYNDEVWIAYQDRLGHPDRAPTYKIGFPSTWWIDSAKDQQTQ
ncbi:MAG: ABC transporter substrate-binding protein [Gammaproteobacteria bacterium]|nr:ABC transporter substrate-binding protein [Gammaproteobacteria bacterium]